MPTFTPYIWSDSKDGKYVKTSNTYGKYIPGSYLQSLSLYKYLSITGTAAPTVYYFDNSTQRKNIRINASYDSTVVFNSTIAGDKLSLFADDFKITKVILDGSLNTSADVSLYLSKIDLFGNSGNNTLIGNSSDNKIDGGLGNDTMIGGKGNDTYIVQSVGDVTTENINEGTDTVQSSITWTLGANLENLTLTGTNATSGTGNALNNILTGNSVNNVLDGGLGSDTMIGGLGDDTYIVDDFGDVTTENINEGTDTVQSSITWTLGANLENLTLTGTNVINGTGNGLNNILTGNSANNVLDGGLGSDTMIGGLGDDTYIVGNFGDVIIERMNSGTDIVKSSVSWTLGANLENLTLTGTNAINGVGNDLNNVLTGNSANNILDCGLGSDTMIGGLGDDTYIVDDLNDSVLEYENGGNDTVFSSVNYYLNITSYYEIENVTLTGNENLNISGSYKSNVLTGNSGNNILDGGAIFSDSGPSSFDENESYIYSDTLIGGKGDDTYYVQSNADTVIEYANEGTDSVYSNFGYILPSNVENLTLNSNFSNQSADYFAIGNNLNNTLIGNEYDNFIQGKEGDDILIGNGGNDTLDGGSGKDTYVFDIGSASISKKTYTVNSKTYNDPVFDKITGLEIGTDSIDTYGSGVRKVTNIGKLNVANNVFSYDNVISALNSKFTKDNVFVFNYGQRTFLGVDDGVAGFNVNRDCVIEITGYTGNLANLIVI